MQLPVPEHKSSCPLPGFVEIMRSLWGKSSLWMVVGVPAGQDEESYEPVSSSIMAMWLFQHPILGDMYTDMLTCTMSFVDLGIDPFAGDLLKPCLQGGANLNSNTVM